MDREKESPPERLPFCLDDTVGEIVRASQECPGVYYIAARKQDGKFLADEYYVVEKNLTSHIKRGYGIWEDA